jgi:dipeptidyl aminopeptidase/acylaminoacyl peptidase
VAFANPRGSTGYGDAFSKSIIGCWGKPEHKDFDAVLDELVARGIADPDSLGVTGVSGGGHLSGWLIGQTNRFKAAVPEQGVYNMFSMYGVSDAGVALIALEMDGPPHKQSKRYWELSPVAHAHKCKTPTLLIIAVMLGTFLEDAIMRRVFPAFFVLLVVYGLIALVYTHVVFPG